MAQRGDFGVYRVNERTTAVFAADITDETATGIPGSALDALTLTLYEQTTGAIINSRDGANVLNANGGTVDEAGHFIMVFTPADNQHMGTDTSEVHIALFRWTYNTVKQGSQRVILSVINEPKVA